MNFIAHLGVLVAIYLVLAHSLNLPLGFGGLVSFCHAAFYGIGAYSYAIVVVEFGVHPLLAITFSSVFTACVAVVVGSISLRFRGDLFLFVTLGFQVMIFTIIYNWVDVTNGPYGIARIPRPEIFGVVVRTPLQYAALALGMTLVLLALLFVLSRAPFGRALRALREDEPAAEALGIHPNRLYLQAFVVSAAVAAVAGAFYATYVTYIDPTSFTIKESIYQVAILLLGGAGNHRGPSIGVLVMLLLPEGLRFLGMPEGIAHNAREIIYGLLLAVLMYVRPQGIAGDFRMAQR